MALDTIASVPVLLAAIYLVGLATVAITRPALARQFLHGFASTAALHFIELLIRTIVGTAFIVYAPHLRLSAVFTVSGWVLVVTTFALLFVPWKLHRRFAVWSVPLATKHMVLLSIGSLISGLFILTAYVLGPESVGNHRQ